MTTPSTLEKTVPLTLTGTTPALDSADLFQSGEREIFIRHGEACYRLRLTNSNKLILVK